MWDGEDEDPDGEEVEEDEDAGAADGECRPCAAGQPIEHVEAPFLSGHPSVELLAGSIGFLRFEEPAGVHGLRPPPLRSNLICLLAVPSYLNSGDLIRFMGGYARYVRHMRMVRDA